MRIRTASPAGPDAAYGTGEVDGAILVSLELAMDQEEYETRVGSWMSTAMSAERAIELGQALTQLGEQAKATALN